jgi:acetolactate decarboxylase
MTSPTIAGSLAMVPALQCMRRDGVPLGAQAGELYQTSIMGALFEGVYDGDVTYGSLREHGDFGLGTFNELDGEMVAFDGEFYQLRSDGSARPVDPQQKTPFAVVTFFRSEIEREISSPLTKAELEKLVDGLTNDNLFHAVRVDALFSEISTRTVSRQQKPYAPLAEAGAQEVTNRSINVRGTLAGFRSPYYAQIVSGAGYHLHFLRDDRLAGGHVLDYVLARGHVAISPAHALHMEMPSTPEFGAAKLSDPSLTRAIRDVEN